MSDLTHKSATSATKPLRNKLTGQAAFLLAGAFFGSILIYFGVREPNAMYDPQGGASFFCDVRKIATVESSLGMVLMAKNTTCTVFGTSSIAYDHFAENMTVPSATQKRLSALRDKAGPSHATAACLLVNPFQQGSIKAYSHPNRLRRQWANGNRHVDQEVAAV